MYKEIKSESNLSKKFKNRNKRVIRICDNCFHERSIRIIDLFKNREKRNHKDYCLPCSRMLFMSGQNNPMKNPINQEKCSTSKRGTKDYSKRKSMFRYTEHGYLMKYSQKYKRNIPEHRVIIEEQIGRPLTSEEVVHHINGNKLDNRIENLILCSGKSKHQKIHSSLEKTAMDLVSKDYICFDRLTNTYRLNPDIQIKSLRKSLGFQDIAIEQKKNICKSRLDVDISSEPILGIKLAIPLIAANMSTVTNSEYCILLNKLGAMGVLHRAGTLEYRISEVIKVASVQEYVPTSIGLTNTDFDESLALIRAGANILFLDIAHGYTDAVIPLIKKIKSFSHTTKIVVGNTTNPTFVTEVAHLADAIKVGIAQGFACETKNSAGCTELQFSAVLRCAAAAHKFGIPIISDGGIREPADFTKAIGAGASAVMAGKIFAACPESAAELVSYNDKTCKLYAGMASRYVQESWKGGIKEGTCPEGKVTYLDIGESTQNLLTRYSGALRSGITYAGSNNITSFWENVSFIQI